MPVLTVKQIDSAGLDAEFVTGADVEPVAPEPVAGVVLAVHGTVTVYVPPFDSLMTVEQMDCTELLEVGPVARLDSTAGPEV